MALITANRESRRHVRSWLFAILIAGGIATVVYGVIIASIVLWGRDQSITATYVERNLTAGAIVAEAEFQLGLRPDPLHGTLTVWPGGSKLALLGESGIGAMFAPQNEFAFEFEADGKLKKAWVDVVYQCDENGYEIQLPPQRKN